METEFEVKILDIDVEQIEQRLRAIGAERALERDMKRLVYDLEGKNRWLRLRDDGEQTTLTVKEIVSDAVDGTKEIELSVEDFEKARALLNALGLRHKAYQENRRISYTLGDVAIEIDFWPGIPPYLEIEGTSVHAVKVVVRILGFDMAETTTMNTYEVYEHHGKNLRDLRDVRFPDHAEE